MVSKKDINSKIKANKAKNKTLKLNAHPVPGTGLDVRDTEIKSSFQPIKSCPLVLPGINLPPLHTLKTLGTKSQRQGRHCLSMLSQDWSGAGITQTSSKGKTLLLSFLTLGMVMSHRFWLPCSHSTHCHVFLACLEWPIVPVFPALTGFPEHGASSAKIRAIPGKWRWLVTLCANGSPRESLIHASMHYALVGQMQ